MTSAPKGRFAPSPTGRMHAGNIFSCLMMWLLVKSQNGKIALRIEDLDKDRSKQEYIDLVQTDLENLGLTWDEGPFFQHNREDAYRSAFEALERKNLVYECFCSRADLHSQSAPHFGEKYVYAGTCRNLTEAERQVYNDAGKNPSYRLIVPDTTIAFNDLFQGRYEQNLIKECGDFLIRRSDGAFAYQLAVVVDDAYQDINTIVRGIDLLSSTPQQIYIQDLFGYKHPTYAHIPLIVNEQGRRLSKRDKDASLDYLLDIYKTPEAVIGHIAYVVGLIERDDSMTPEELLNDYRECDMHALFKGKISIPWT